MRAPRCRTISGTVQAQMLVRPGALDGCGKLEIWISGLKCVQACSIMFFGDRKCQVKFYSCSMLFKSNMFSQLNFCLWKCKVQTHVKNLSFIIWVPIVVWYCLIQISMSFQSPFTKFHLSLLKSIGTSGFRAQSLPISVAETRPLDISQRLP